MKLLKLDIPSGVQHITDEMVFKHKSIRKLSIPQSVLKLIVVHFIIGVILKLSILETNSKLTVISESCFENNTSLRKSNYRTCLLQLKICI